MLCLVVKLTTLVTCNFSHFQLATLVTYNFFQSLARKTVTDNTNQADIGSSTVKTVPVGSLSVTVILPL
jgi:hypothetical protein